MKGYYIILYILMLNLGCGFFLTINWPGTAYSSYLTGTGNSTQYLERFNSTEFMERTEPEASTIFTYVGHIWSGLSLVFDAVSFVFTGFARLLIGVGDQIGDATARTGLTSFGVIVQVVLDFIVFLWIYQLLTGRTVEQ